MVLFVEQWRGNNQSWISIMSTETLDLERQWSQSRIHEKTAFPLSKMEVDVWHSHKCLHSLWELQNPCDLIIVNLQMKRAILVSCSTKEEENLLSWQNFIKGPYIKTLAVSQPICNSFPTQEIRKYSTGWIRKGYSQLPAKLRHMTWRIQIQKQFSFAFTNEESSKLLISICCTFRQLLYFIFFKWLFFWVSHQELWKREWKS